MVRGAGLAGCLLAAGCFFEPELDAAPIAGTTEVAGSTGGDDSTSGITGGPTSEGDASGGAVCGDGKIEEGEACDAGAANGEGGLCKADCALNVCGDGYVATSEGCDDGNTADGDGCTAACALEGCGDGVKAGAEECDDGNSNDVDGCTSLCRLPACGDGILHAGEGCDDPEGNAETGACLPDCTAARCGDGFVQVGVEACDDGDADDADECLTTCVAARCGDGFVQAGVEACDGQTATCGDDCTRTAYYVFVTGMGFSAKEVGGPAEADALCTLAAQNSKDLSGNYKAWLSSPGKAAADRLLHSKVPYIRPDGLLVATHWEDLIDGELSARIHVTEQGVALPMGTNCAAKDAVWTGTKPDGTAAPFDCKGWGSTSAMDPGAGGTHNAVDGGWTDCLFQCNEVGRLYCVQQP